MANLNKFQKNEIRMEVGLVGGYEKRKSSQNRPILVLIICGSIP